MARRWLTLAGLTALALLLLLAPDTLAKKPPKPPPDPEPPADPAIACVGDGQLIIMNADGSNRTVLLDAGGDSNALGRPDWSPDGTMLAFWGNVDGPGIYVINVDGTGLSKVIGTTASFPVAVAWSPDAVPGVGTDMTRIAYTDAGSGGLKDLFLVDIQGLDPIQLTSTPLNFENWPTWSPSATRLAVAAWEGPTVRWGLYDFVAGTYSVQPHQGPLQDARVSDPSWSKTEEDKIAWSADDDIWIVDLDDPAHPVPLTSTGSIAERAPSWSPSDAKLVITTAVVRGGRLKNHAIEVMSALDGSGRVPITEGAGLPVWRRNP